MNETQDEQQRAQPQARPVGAGPRATGAAGALPMRGKLPPHSIDLEMAVLGALMLENGAYPKVTEVLTSPDIFYRPAHQHIFTAIAALFENGKPIDLLTVDEELRRMGKLEEAGGSLYLAELTALVASAANVEYHSLLLQEKYMARATIGVCSEVQTKLYDDREDPLEVLNWAESEFYRLSGNSLRREALSMEVLTAKTLRHLEDLRNKGTNITGISTGFKMLDELTSGWQPSDLVIIAARPAMGKTAFVLSLTRNAALQAKKPVLFFSLEMSSTQLAQRLIVAEANLDAQKVRTGRLEDYEFQQLMHLTGELSKAPIYIDDTPGLNINDLRSKCRRMKAEKGIEMVVIDYLQLMSAGGKGNMNREQEVSKISRSLKMLAKELNIPVIALSQLSRATETRGSSKRPMLSDLRESGSIEQDADMVMFLYRPEYYDQLVDEAGNSTEGLCEIIVGKQRNGPIDTVKLHFIKKFGKFEDFFDSPAYGAGFQVASGGAPVLNPYGPNPGADSMILPSRLNTGTGGTSDFEDEFSIPF
jgi:replicative DNA helicase